jgi:membrane associated rhomboid family serine protease
MGHGRFLAWYIAAGLAATSAQTAITLWFAGPVEASIPNVGASGAIAGVLGAYLPCIRARAF